jgi:hypothetical protein
LFESVKQLLDFVPGAIGQRTRLRGSAEGRFEVTQSLFGLLKVAVEGVGFDGG